jgi:DNA polymerase-3 subunit delta
LQRLLEQQDPYSTFGMIVRQFRLLLQARQVLDRGGQRGDLLRALGVAPFVVDKLIGQARHFSLPDLEAIYHRLLNLDVTIKTSQSPPELALTTFVAAFTTSPAPQGR